MLRNNLLVNEQLEQLSKELAEKETPHLFMIFTGDEVDYRAFIGFAEACQVITLLAKQHGGSVIDTVVDKLLDAGEWPETIQ